MKVRISLACLKKFCSNVFCFVVVEVCHYISWSHPTDHSVPNVNPCGKPLSPSLLRGKVSNKNYGHVPSMDQQFRGISC